MSRSFRTRSWRMARKPPIAAKSSVADITSPAARISPSVAMNRTTETLTPNATIDNMNRS